MGKTPQIIHLFIGFFSTIIFTIHFWGKKHHFFLETSVYPTKERQHLVIVISIFCSPKKEVPGESTFMSPVQRRGPVPPFPPVCWDPFLVTWLTNSEVAGFSHEEVCVCFFLATNVIYEYTS